MRDTRLDYWRWFALALRNTLSGQHLVTPMPDGRSLKITLAMTGLFQRNSLTIFLDQHSVLCQLPDSTSVSLWFRSSDSGIGLSDGQPKSPIMGPADAAEYLLRRIARCVDDNAGSNLYLRS